MKLKYYLVIDGDYIHIYDKGPRASEGFLKLRREGKTGLDYLIAVVDTQSDWPTIELWIVQAYPGKFMLDHRDE